MTEIMTSKTQNRQSVLDVQMESAKENLSVKLLNIDIPNSGISPYNQRYLNRQIQNAKSVLDRYGKILMTSLTFNSKPLDQIALVDYGGGSGMLSLLAKELGVGKVVYNDIYDVSCNDMKTLSKLLSTPVDEVVCGDLDILIDYLKERAINIDTIVSNDVVEHIYDVEKHFNILSLISDGEFRVVYSTNAIISNPVYVYLVRKSQIEVETKNRSKKWGDKERDTLEAYVEVRKRIIKGHAPQLADRDLEYLAKMTRGLIKADIEHCVDQYLIHGRINYRPDHPTNTCDPYTGNWCEHLMNIDWLRKVVEDAGFSTALVCGTYAVTGAIHKKVAKLVLNVIIRTLGNRGLFAAPYFILCADRKMVSGNRN